ncbi:glycosyltransferase family 2 protein [Candidatus Gottesmanbacteria bacterium]|nr:glycosyltransferase family 2 protein [Candidatus Gottesmanbacteria bacterium]
MAKISVAIATYNEEKNLGTCLDSVASWVHEIVLVDGGSTDETIGLAKKYKAKIIQTNNPPIFHINKQKALEACRGDWIFQLDADEIVTEELKNEILSVIPAKPAPAKAGEPGSNQKKNWIPGQARNDNMCSGYYIPRKNFFLGHWLKKGGQYPDYVIRLFQHGKGKFPCKSVHEQIQIDGSVGYLQNPLLHYTSRTRKEYWRKAHAYIALTAQELKEKKLPLNVFTYVQYNLVKPTITFLSLFLRHKGFVDGVYGFLFAFFSALHHPLAYMRYVKSHR